MLISYKVFEAQVFYSYVFLCVILHQGILRPVLYSHFSVKKRIEPCKKRESIHIIPFNIQKETCWV